MKLLDFINKNENWEQILSSPPYNLIIKKDGDYILLKYSQIESDFKEQMVKEARGIIIKKQNGLFIPICVPFTKFFAYGDPNAQDDLKTLYNSPEWLVEEKIDGSLIKLFYDNDEWHIATNGTINAFNAEIANSLSGINNYGELFLAASKDKIDWDKLDKGYTYMFELVSLENKVIVTYRDRDVYYLGRRNMETLKEISYYDDDLLGVSKCSRPKCNLIKLHNDGKAIMEQIHLKVNSLNENCDNFEGYVVSDLSLKTRIKMKSERYLELSTFRGEGIITYKKILLMITQHKDDDFITYFPEYVEQVEKVKQWLNDWLRNIETDLQYMAEHTWEQKKDFAEWAKQTTCSTIMFSAYKEEQLDKNWLEDKINSIPIDKLLGYIERKD